MSKTYKDNEPCRWKWTSSSQGGVGNWNWVRNSYKERPPLVIPSEKGRVNNPIGISNLKWILHFKTVFWKKDKFKKKTNIYQFFVFQDFGESAYGILF